MIMKFLDGIKKVVRFFDKITDQGDLGYEFSYDAAQKILFLLTMLVLFGIPWGEYTFAVFIICCIFGRMAVMPFLERVMVKVDKVLGNDKKRKPFLWVPRPIWKLLVLAVLTYILIQEIIGGDFAAIPTALIMYVVGFFIFTGYTSLVSLPPDPSRRGSPAWRKENGVEQVGFDLMKPRWRDKNGNYYEGLNCLPIPTPVEIVKKDK